MSPPAHFAQRLRAAQDGDCTSYAAVDEQRGITLLVDSLGGGGQAAKLAGKALMRELVAGLDEPALSIGDALLRAFARTETILRSIDQLPGDPIAVCAVAAVLDAARRSVWIAHIGDARAYVLRRFAAAQPPSPAPRFSPPVERASGARLHCLTRDHSTVCEVVERGHLSRAQGRTHGLRQRLNRLMGRGQPATPDVLELTLMPRDRILLCSRGVWPVVEDDVLARLLDWALATEQVCQSVLDEAIANSSKVDLGMLLVDWLDEQAFDTPAKPNVPAQPPPERAKSVLEKFGRDLTAQAMQNKLEPVIGRKAEIRRVAQVLTQMQKSNALLVGDAGVGKTCIVEGLAQVLVSEKCPEALRAKRVIEISLSAVVAGTKYRGELEEKLQELLRAVEADPNVILFIDEIHALAGAGAAEGALDAANIFKPALARGQLRLIGATTTQEYERHIARDEALARRFEVIRVAEPAPDQALEIMRGLRGRFEQHYGVEVADDALVAAINLSVRHLPERRLPDKAVELVDQACSRKMLKSFTRTDSPVSVRDVVDWRDVAQVVAERCRVPIDLVAIDDQQRLRTLRELLARRVIGQPKAVAAVGDAIERAYDGIKNPSRPIASFLFVGPTGVGKTEMAKGLAEALFASPDALIRIDMSELGERHAVARLLGAPPGYVGHEEEGQLTAAIRRRPASVVLFDELEKAHPDVLTLLLQVLDEGTLTDARGRPASFREAVIAMTSNLVPEVARERAPIGFGQRVGHAPSVGESLREGLRGQFRPEILGRIGAVVGFDPLDATAMAQIADKLIADWTGRLAGRLIVPPAVGARVRERARSVVGVRELQRVVEEELGALLRGHATQPAVEHDGTLDDLPRGGRGESAMLLLDIVQSTKLVHSLGDTRFSHVVGDLVARLRSHASAGALRYVKGVGDGVLALFHDMAAAFAVAQTLELAGEPPVKVRRVLHWGRIKRGSDGDPLGVEVHRLFRVEKVKEQDRVGGGEPLPDDPSQPILTASARQQLPEPLRQPLFRIGEFRLHGFPDVVEIWTVMRN